MLANTKPCFNNVPRIAARIRQKRKSNFTELRNESRRLWWTREVSNRYVRERGSPV